MANNYNQMGWKEIITGLLLIIGGLNWGSVGLLNYNIVGKLTQMAGMGIILEKIVYILIGITGIYMLYDIIKFYMTK